MNMFAWNVLLRKTGFFVFLLMFWGCSESEELLCPQIEITALQNELGEETESQININEILSYQAEEGENLNLSFRIKNIGGNVLKIGEVQSEQDSTLTFTLTQATQNRFETEESDIFLLDFENLEVGEYQIPITIFSNDWDEPVFTFFVKVVVSPPPPPQFPDIKVYQNDTFIPSPDGIYTLENTEVGSSYTIVFTIRNEGVEILSISDILSTEPNFNIEFSSQTLSPNQEMEFSVIFEPSEAINYSTQIQIQNNDPDTNENPYLFQIISNPNPAPAPDITVFRRDDQNTNIPDGFAFVEGGELEIGFQEIFEFEIENQGNATLNLISLTIDNPDYEISSLTTNALEPTETTRFAVRYTSSSEGESIGTVSIGNNDPDENPFTFQIRFRGKESLFRIRYKTVSTPDGLNTVPSNTGANRTLFEKDFDVIDPDEIVTQNAILRVSVTSSNGLRDSFSVGVNGTDGRRIRFENDFDKMFYRQSIRFAEATYLDFDVYLELPTGERSNLESYRLLRPNGAN